MDGICVGFKEGASDWTLEGATVRSDGTKVGICDGSAVGHWVGYWVVGADDEAIGCDVGRLEIRSDGTLVGGKVSELVGFPEAGDMDGAVGRVVGEDVLTCAQILALSGPRLAFSAS